MRAILSARGILCGMLEPVRAVRKAQKAAKQNDQMEAAQAMRQGDLERFVNRMVELTLAIIVLGALFSRCNAHAQCFVGSRLAADGPRAGLEGASRVLILARGAAALSQKGSGHGLDPVAGDRDRAWAGVLRDNDAAPDPGAVSQGGSSDLDRDRLLLLAHERGAVLGSSTLADCALIAAWVCYLESEWRKTDCAAILWSAAARSRARLGSPAWLDHLWSYSAPALSRVSAKRIEYVRYSSKRWTELVSYVQRVIAGDVRNPCPHATHFGGRMDSPRGRMVPARCAVPTANQFYELARR